MASIGIAECCYMAHSIKDTIDMFTKQLERGNLDDKNRANSMRKYYTMISKKVYIERMEHIIKKIQKDVFGKQFPGIQEKTELRIKSVLSTDAKIQLLQQEAQEAVAAGKRPREIFPRDIFAFRIIVLDKGKVKGVDDCYKIMNFLLPYLVEELGCILEVSTGTVGTEGFKKEEHPEVIFPSEGSQIEDEYQLYVKNYIMDPKKNGYQAMHVTVLDTVLNFQFEIQVETQTMFRNSQLGDQAHEGHKTKKYADIYAKEGGFDPSKVHMLGFYYYPAESEDDDDELVDYIGLVMPRLYSPFVLVNI